MVVTIDEPDDPWKVISPDVGHTVWDQIRRFRHLLRRKRRWDFLGKNDRERIVIESSVISATLLFAIAAALSKSDNSASFAEMTAYFSGIACVFMIAALFATIVIMVEPDTGTIASEVLGVAEFTPFMTGFLMMVLTLYGYAKNFVGYANVVYFVVIYVVVVGFCVTAFRLLRRRQKKPKGDGKPEKP